MRTLSVVICNHNYARFLAESVESALALQWPDVEVVVVDDGSTDESLRVLNAYRDRVEVIATENRGQREAANLGFASSHGDAVVFLDSDDVLPPDLPSEVATRLVNGVSKVQFQMQRIDTHGKQIGVPFPQYRHLPSPESLRRWFLSTTAYPTPPGSGNVYARTFLDQILPLGPECGQFADSGMLAAAPILGDVVAVEGLHVGYRRHDGNDSVMTSRRTNFMREIERARDRWVYASRLAGIPSDPARIFRSREVLQFRVAAARFTPDLRLLGDNRIRILRDALISPLRPGPESVARRVFVALWVLSTLIAPRLMAAALIRRRYQ